MHRFNISFTFNSFLYLTGSIETQYYINISDLSTHPQSTSQYAFLPDYRNFPRTRSK